MKLPLLLLLFPVFIHAQTLFNGQPFPQQQVNAALQKAWEEKDNALSCTSTQTQTGAATPSGIYQLLQQKGSGNALQQSTLKSAGILYVGNTPNDTLVVTGPWQNNSPVFVVNDGVLIFNNAQATISGFLLVAGTGKIIATNSSFYFPQQYFYEWGLQAAQHGQMYMRNCTLDFNGLAHDIGISDSATLIQQNVYFNDNNTTTGINNQATYILDSVNLAGEIVATDSIHLILENVDTVKVWHQVMNGQGLTWTFPNGINLQHYAIGPDSAGVTGIQYTVEADNIEHLFWALMPDNGSNVNISNSTITSVGVLFSGTDTANVQGLVDNSTYTTSPTFFTDRTFHLNNCSVQTWGIYPGDTSIVNITSCIAGEIGSGGMAKTNCSDLFADGSAGYVWANSKAFLSSSGCGLKCPIRAEQAGFVISAFNSITAATGYAIDSGLLIMIQTPTISAPVAYDGSDVWVGMLSPQSANTGDTVLLTGSAYILRGPTSRLMSFSSYYVAYQAPGSNSYVTIGDTSATPVTQNTLASWPTIGLAPGQYNLVLIIKDNYGDSVTVNSAITLQPIGTGIANIQNSEVKVYPNPTTNQLTITADQMAVNKVTLLNMLGQTVFNYNYIAGDKTPLNIDFSTVPAGVYIYRVTDENAQVVEGKVVKM